MPESIAQRSFRVTVPGGPAASPAVCAVDALLAAEGFVAEPQPFWDRARSLVREPSPLGHSLAARLGLIYIQDRSSMLPPLALFQGLEPGGTVLDLCAAPGSKTGMLSLLAGPRSLVLACEPSPDRLAVLRAGLMRTQALNTATVRSAGERLRLGGRVGAILLDPPCSGWGTTDKHPRARDLWTGERVEPMLRLQRALLERADELLEPGGLVAYSTCTSNPDENEDQVAWAMAELGLELVLLDPPPGVALAETGLAGTLNVALEAGQQGFYVALLRKPRRGDGQATPDSATQTPATANQAALHENYPGRDLDADLPRALDRSALGPGCIRVFGGQDSSAKGPAKGRRGKPGKPIKAQAVFVPARAAHWLDPAGPWQGTPVGKVVGGRFLPDVQSRALLPAEPGPGCVELDLEQLRALASGASLHLGLEDGPVGVYWQGLALCWAVSRSGRLLGAVR